MLRNLEGTEVGSELDNCTEHHPFVDIDIRKLTDPIKDTLPPKQYHYFSFHILSNHEREKLLKTENLFQ